MKIKEIYINEYKIFKEFKINFTDEKDEPLDIIVLAGVNGSGKTTLLEYIYNFMKYLENQTKRILLPSFTNFIDVVSEHKTKGLGNLDSQFNNSLINYKIEKENFERYKSEYNQSIIYLPIYESSIENIKNSILIYYRIISRQLDSHTKALKEIQTIIDDIFKGMDINLIVDDVDDIDKNNEKVIFKNKSGDTFNIEELSTGQKTLLSKILYLYFKNIRDKVILIDEPELSLHPAWQNRVLKLYENFAKENNCQIIIATHSPHIIGSANSKYIRLLVEENGVIEVVDNLSNSYGAKFSQILTDIMGVKDLRTPEVNQKFTQIEDMIIENQFDTKKFKEKWQELENILGKNYFDLKLLKLEIASRRKDVQNR
jgi:predicted ATP-binding protein involved in virulence